MLLHFDAVEVHRGLIDVFDAVVGAVCFGPDRAFGRGGFADDFAGSVADDVFGGTVDDDHSGEIVVMERDFFAGFGEDFHHADAVVFEDGFVTDGGGFERFERMLGARRDEQADEACEDEESFHGETLSKRPWEGPAVGAGLSRLMNRTRGQRG